ncbi:MAG: HAD family hydrolase [Promethearchaeota archaeon]
MDFDDTLVNAAGKHEDFAVLAKLRKMGVELCITSRNDRYHLEIRLNQLSLQDCFRYVMADFRPKSYQIKHLLWLYEKRGCQFNEVLFVDDHLPNILRVREDIPEIKSYQFGHDISSLAELLELVQALG